MGEGGIQEPEEHSVSYPWRDTATALLVLEQLLVPVLSLQKNKKRVYPQPGLGEEE